MGWGVGRIGGTPLICTQEDIKMMVQSIPYCKPWLFLLSLGQSLRTAQIKFFVSRFKVIVGLFDIYQPW